MEGGKAPITNQVKWLFVFMVVSHLKAFFPFSLIHALYSSRCMDEYIFIKQIIKAAQKIKNNRQEQLFPLYRYSKC